MSTALKDIHGRIAERRGKLATLFAKKDEAGKYDWSAEDRDAIKAIEAELDDLCPQYDELRENARKELANRDALKSLDTPFDTLPFGGADRPPFTPRPTLGEALVASDAFKAFVPGSMNARLNFDFAGTPQDAFKAVMTETSTGYAPANNRTPVVVLSAQRRIMVPDLIPSDPTDLQQIKFMKETTFTNSAASASEGASLPASTLAYTQATSTVEQIGTTIQATNQQMADVAALPGLINQRLEFQVGLSEENELLNGSGTTPHLNGFLGAANSTLINTRALGASARPDVILDAMTDVRFNTGSVAAGFAEPSGIIFHPTDWANLRKLKDSLGNYLWGSPSEAGPFSVWGLAPVVTPVIAQGTILVGDFRGYAHISRRMGITVEVGLVNDDFQKNQVTIRAYSRLSLEVRRAAAFCSITGF